jgi:hypothetical protein
LWLRQLSLLSSGTYKVVKERGPNALLAIWILVCN